MYSFIILYVSLSLGNGNLFQHLFIDINVVVPRLLLIKLLQKSPLVAENSKRKNVWDALVSSRTKGYMYC